MFGLFSDLFAEVVVGIAIYLWHAKLAFLAGMVIAKMVEWSRKPKTVMVESRATIADM